MCGRGLLGGCSLAPKPPPTEAVAHFKEAGDWMPAQPADAQPRGHWWEAFGDPKLNELETQLARQPGPAGCGGALPQARAVARQARSDVFPTVGR